MCNEITVLKSFNLSTSFPSKRLQKIETKIHPNYFLSKNAKTVSKNIELFFQTHQNEVLQKASYEDLTQIKNNISLLASKIKDSSSTSSLKESLLILDKLIVKKIKHEKELTLIEKELQKLDFAKHSFPADVRKLIQHIRTVKECSPELEALEKGLLPFQKPSFFSSDDVETRVINLYRSTGVKELIEDVETHLIHLENCLPSEFESKCKTFSKDLEKMAKKYPHLVSCIRQIALSAATIENGNTQTNEKFLKRSQEILKANTLNCEDYDFSEKHLAKAAQVDYLKLLQGKNLSQLIETDAVEKALFEIQQKTQKSRLETLGSYGTIATIRNLIERLNQKKTLFSKCLDDSIQQIHLNYDRKSNNQFSKLIQKYPEIDLRAQKESILEWGLNSYLELIKKRGIDAAESESISFSEKLKASAPYYQWFIANIPYFKKFHNQGEDPHRNMSNGTCLQDACDLAPILMKNPHISIDEITMGSTTYGRFVKASLKAGIKRDIKHEHLTKNNLYVRERKALNFSKIPGPYGQMVIEQLLNKNAPHDTVIPLFMHNGTEGHVLVIQFDRNRGIFRFFDPNFGAAEYPTERLFLTHFSSLLNLYSNQYSKFEALYMSSTN